MAERKDCYLRRMSADDIPDVVRIEQSLMDSPWSAQLFQDCLNAGYEAWVFESEQIIGYGLLSAAAQEAHVLNVCIARDEQGHGLGKKMMVHLIARAVALSAQSIYLEVRESNQRAYQLYQNLGFAVIGRRRGYYPLPEGREDALVLELCLV